MPILQEAARDPGGEVRALACRFLAEGLGDPSESVPVLIAAADDRVEDVRIEVARGLGRVARYRSVPMGGRSSTGLTDGLAPALREGALRTVRRLFKDPSRMVRTEATGALGEFGPDPAAVADLTAAVGDDDRTVRLAAARALIKINGPDDPAAARALIAMVASPDAVPDRQDVLGVVKTMSEPVRDRAVAALVALLSHGDPDIVPDVIACLPEAGPRAKAALPALEALLDDPEPGVLAAAGMAIVTIECQEDPPTVPNGSNTGMGGGAGMAAMSMGGSTGPAIVPGAGQGNPRSIAILLRIIADAAVQQDVRENAIAMVRGVNPSTLAKVTPDLVRQLAAADPNIRRNAVELLSMLIDVAPVELPTASRARPDSRGGPARQRFKTQDGGKITPTTRHDFGTNSSHADRR